MLYWRRGWLVRADRSMVLQYQVMTAKRCNIRKAQMCTYKRKRKRITIGLISRFILHGYLLTFSLRGVGNNGSLLSFRLSLVRGSLWGSLVTDSGFASCMESDADAASMLLSISASRVSRKTQGAMGCFQSSRRSGMMKTSSHRGITNPSTHHTSKKCPMMKPIT